MLVKRFHISSKIISVFLPIFLITTLVFLPIIVKPSVYLNRNNDLTEFFWPIYYFVKQQILINHTFPLWNNLFLSGTPLLPDPQAPLFYLPNVIFLILPLGTAFVVSAFLHVFLGGVGIFYASRLGLKFSRRASLITAIFYVSAPKLASFLEAGHVGLVNTWAWIPFVILATLKIAERPKTKWSVLLGGAMAGLFYSHTIIFLITSASSFFLLLTATYVRKKRIFKSFLSFVLGACVAFGLCAISLLPQLAWRDLTTRNLLTIKPQIYPIWTSKGEFLKAIFVPWNAQNGIQGIDTEMWVPIGILMIVFAFFGFLKIGKKLKIFLILFSLIILLISLGNASPIYSFLIRQDWFVEMRIPTRVFFPLMFIAIFLAGYSFDKSKLSTWIAGLIVCESIFLSWSYLQKPIHQRHDVPKEIYQILQNDKDRFRVLCLTNCISQKEAVERGIELVEGYSTLTQMNYYTHSFQLIGGYWDYYSIPLPPDGVYLFQDLKPNINSLAKYNTKYLIYTNKLNDPDLELIGKYGDFYLYKILNFQPRASSPIVFYSANEITVNTENYNEKNVIFSEVYSPGWNAYLNGKEKVSVQETPDALRLVDIKPDTKFVEIKYEPKSYFWGRIITFSTYIGILIYCIKSYRKNKK